MKEEIAEVAEQVVDFPVTEQIVWMSGAADEAEHRGVDAASACVAHQRPSR